MFIGRDQEIKLLQDLKKSPKPELGIIYGRRRVGKSTLLEKMITEKVTTISKLSRV